MIRRSRTRTESRNGAPIDAMPPEPPDYLAFSRAYPVGSDRRGVSALQFMGNETPNSLGLAMRELARACHRIGVETGLELLAREPRRTWARTSVRHLLWRPRPPSVLVAWGYEDTPAAEFEGLRRVSWDVYDSWRWSRSDVVDAYNEHISLLCVTSPRAADAYRDAGVKPPIVALPLGVNGGIYRPWKRDRGLVRDCAEWFTKPPDEDTFVFIVAGYNQPRKGLPIALEAFKRAFKPSDNVALLVKTVSAQWGQPARKPVLEALPDYRAGVCERSLNEWDFARLMASCDCYVASHHQEGFGMVPLQAMACGTQVVITDFAGPQQYLQADVNAICVQPRGIIPAREDQQWEPSGTIPETTDWADLDPDDFAAAMQRAIREDPKKRIAGGLKTAAAYSWDAAAEKFAAAVEEHVAPLRRRAKPKPEAKQAGAARGSETLTIAAPMHNGAPHVERWCETAKRTQWGGRVDLLLLDDGSTDGSQEIAEKCGARVLRSDAWIGEWGQRARVFDEVAGGYLFTTDVDVEFTDEDWALKLREALKPKTILHPIMLSPDGTVWSAGGRYRDLIGKLLPCAHFASCEPWTEALRERLRKEPGDKPLAYAPGAGWFFRTADVAPFVDWVGGFYPSTFADVDMAFWLRSHGIEFHLFPDVTLMHHHGSFTIDQCPSDSADKAMRRTDILETHALEFAYWWDHVTGHDQTQDIAG